MNERLLRGLAIGGILGGGIGSACIFFGLASNLWQLGRDHETDALMMLAAIPAIILMGLCLVVALGAGVPAVARMDRGDRKTLSWVGLSLASLWIGVGMAICLRIIWIALS